MIQYRFDFTPIERPSRFLCSVDPITLTGLALGGLAGAAAGSIGGGGGGSPTPTAPPPQAPPAQSPAQKAMPKSQQPTFLGASATPATGAGGGKTLLGQ